MKKIICFALMMLMLIPTVAFAAETDYIALLESGDAWIGKDTIDFPDAEWVFSENGNLTQESAEAIVKSNLSSTPYEKFFEIASAKDADGNNLFLVMYVSTSKKTFTDSENYPETYSPSFDTYCLYMEDGLWKSELSQNFFDAHFTADDDDGTTEEVKITNAKYAEDAVKFDVEESMEELIAEFNEQSEYLGSYCIASYEEHFEIVKEWGDANINIYILYGTDGYFSIAYCADEGSEYQYIVKL